MSAPKIVPATTAPNRVPGETSPPVKYENVTDTTSQAMAKASPARVAAAAGDISFIGTL